MRGRGKSKELPREHEAPIERGPTPATAVLERLAAAKRAGGDFDIAWAAALADMGRGPWRTALRCTEHEWRAAFYDQPAAGRALRDAVA